MRIGLLNLMPNKIRTETQIARLLAATPAGRTDPGTYDRPYRPQHPSRSHACFLPSMGGHAV